MKDLQKQIDDINTQIDSLKLSYQIPREIETAFRERLGINLVLTGTGITTAGNTTTISSFPFQLPANPSGALTVTYQGVSYNLLYK